MARASPGSRPTRDGWGPLVREVAHVEADDLAALSATFERHRREVAAFIGEPVCGAAGVQTA